MKKALYLVVLMGLQLFTKSIHASNTNVSSFTIEKGIAQAAQDNKLLIAYFKADWCMPSKWMEEKILTQPTIKKYIDQHFLPIKIDVDAKEGLEDQKKYGVNTLPSLIVFDQYGNPLKRIEGTLNSSNLFRELKAFAVAQIATEKVEEETNMGLDLPKLPTIDMSHLDKPALVPEKEISSKPPTKLTNPKPKLPIAKDAYYGVELGVRFNYGAVVRYVRSIESQIPVKIYIRLKRENNQKIYQIFAGKYQSRRDAYELLKRLSAKKIQGSVNILK